MDARRAKRMPFGSMPSREVAQARQTLERTAGDILSAGGDAVAVDEAMRLSWQHAYAAITRSLRAHSIFIALVLAHMIAAIVLPPLFGVSLPYTPMSYFTTMLALTGVAVAVFMAAYTIAVAVAVRPERFWSHVREEVTGKMLTAERLAQALPMIAIFPLFAATFSYFKVTIPVFHPFDWDIRLADWDRLLHGGRDPWELMQPILGYPFITAALNAAYHAWFGVTYGAVLWMMVDTRRSRLCMRYLLTFALIWILLGNVAATVFSSAGPVYYGRVTGMADQFAPLMAYLHAANGLVPVPALNIQELLWRWYMSGSFVAGAGISAMPSLHVGIAFSFFLLGRAIDRRLAFVGGVFAVTILIASVHLGWHYAIDGYAGILGAWVIWAGVGWLLERPRVAHLLWADAITPISAGNLQDRSLH